MTNEITQTFVFKKNWSFKNLLYMNGVGGRREGKTEKNQKKKIQWIIKEHYLHN